MIRTLAFAIMFLAPPALAAGPNGECTCTYAGGDVIEGQTACIRTAKGASLARCEMVLNNTSWTILNIPCPMSQSYPLPETPGQSG